MKLSPKLLASMLTMLTISSCVQPAPDTRPWLLDTPVDAPPTLSEDAPTAVTLPTQRAPGYSYQTPTPDAPHDLAQLAYQC